MMCPRLCAIGALLVAILDQILRPPSLMSCCYRCGVPRAVCCCLLFPQGLLRGFGERHYSSKSLRGTLLVRFTFSPQTPALLPGAVPATHSLCLQQQYQGKKQLMFSHICFFSPKRDPPSLSKLRKSHVPDPQQCSWLQERAAFIPALLAATLPPEK